MALDRRGLKAVAPLASAYPAAAGGAGYAVPQLYGYATADALATVGGAGYFNGLAAELKVGDVILVNFGVGGTVGMAQRWVSANDGTTVTIAAFSA